jgi:hypothetical protein
MSDEILSRLRHAHALSQSGHCVECAQVIISALGALGALRNSMEACSADQQPLRHRQHIVDSLLPLLKCVGLVFALFFSLIAQLHSHALETAVDEDVLPSADLLHLHLQALSFYPQHPDVSVMRFIQLHSCGSHILLCCAATVCHISNPKSCRPF